MITEIDLICNNCSQSFKRRLAEHNNKLRRGQTVTYCSITCSYAGQKLKPKKFVCTYCNVEFDRVVRNKKPVKACSKKCAANLASKARRSDKPTSLCSSCGKKKHRSANVCKSCVIDSFNSLTLSEIKAKMATTSDYHKTVRANSRKNYAGKLICAACGYSLHVDICHIRAVKDFPMSATIAEVNHPDNLIALDKRCHWEFDNGFLEYDVDSKVWKML